MITYLRFSDRCGVNLAPRSDATCSTLAFAGGGPRRDAGVEVVGLECFAAAFAVAVDFGGDPHQRAGELPIVFTLGVDHPDHLPQR